MTLKSDAKFGGKFTCRFKTDIRNLTNFDESTQVSKTFTLMVSFRPMYITFELKKYRGVV